MAGLTIHIAITKEYLRKNGDNIKEKEDFYRGTIAPDFNEKTMELEKDKSRTHYGTWGNGNVELDIKKFLQDPKVKIEQDFWKGYFFHLLSDYYFYHVYFKEEHDEAAENGERLYHDYDCLNKVLLNKYEIVPVECLDKWMRIVEGKTKYLKQEKVIQFIEEIASINIEKQIEIINRKGMEGIV